MRRKFMILGMLLACICLVGCAGRKKAVEETTAGQADTEMEDESAEEMEDASAEEQEDAATSQANTEQAEKPDSEPEILHFVDVFGEEYEVEVDPEVARHPYDLKQFQKKDGVLTYEDGTYRSRWGIDVSKHQGEIDWKTVREAGVEFAFIRIGYRGYGESGSLNLDDAFQRNITAAREAGIDVGVYFFSQAINSEEAEEEADFVLQNLSGYELQLPVVYDPEHILDDEARTDDVPGSQFTENTKIFCKKMKAAGYDVMIYSNMLWEAFEYDLKQLEEYPIWYADYEPLPQTPYQFEFWQYTNEGSVPGILGDMDLNIQILPK